MPATLPVPPLPWAIPAAMRIDPNSAGSLESLSGKRRGLTPDGRHQSTPCPGDGGALRLTDKRTARQRVSGVPWYKEN